MDGRHQSVMLILYCIDASFMEWVSLVLRIWDQILSKAMNYKWARVSLFGIHSIRLFKIQRNSGIRFNIWSHFHRYNIWSTSLFLKVLNIATIRKILCIVDFHVSWQFLGPVWFVRASPKAFLNFTLNYYLESHLHKIGGAVDNIHI